MKKSFVKIGDDKIAFVDEGEGFPVLFIHGFPTSSFLWKDVIPKLNARYRCVAPDLLGFGDSEVLSRDFSLEAQFKMIVNFMEELRIDKAHIVAHDHGGAIAQMLAVRTPERVEKMALIDVVCYDNWPVRGVKLMKVLASIPVVAEQLLASKLLRKSASLFGGGLSGGFHDRKKLTQQIIAEHERTIFSSAQKTKNLARYLRTLDNNVTREIAQKLKTLSMPVLLVWAENDRYFDKRWALKMREDIPNAVGPVMIKECGHFVPWEKADELSAILLKFLSH